MNFKPLLNLSGFLSVGIGFFGILLSYLINGSVGEVLSFYGVNPPTALLFNLTLIISGFLATIFAYSFVKAYNFSPVHPIAILFFAASISIIGIGLVPAYKGTMHEVIHWIFAAIFFFTYPIAIFLIGVRLLKQKTFATLSTIFGFLGVIFVYYLFQIQGQRLYAQVIGLTISCIWVMIASIYMKKMQK